MPSISATSSTSWTCFPRMWKYLTTFPSDSTASRSSPSISTRWWGGLSLSELRLPATIVPRVWRYRWYRKCPRHVCGSNERRQAYLDTWPNYLGLHQTKWGVEDCERPLLRNTQGSVRIEPGHMGAWR